MLTVRGRPLRIPTLLTMPPRVETRVCRVDDIGEPLGRVPCLPRHMLYPPDRLGQNWPRHGGSKVALHLVGETTTPQAS